MNFKNMGSEVGKDSRHPQQQQAATPATPLPLARQLSIYSLTFDEFQNSLGGPGKDFGSMNMDEFLRNIWTAEETQAMTSALGATSDSCAPGGPGGPSGLQRQGSLTLPRTLSQKTVDEVWKDLLRESGTGAAGPAVGGGGAGGGPELQQHRQPTLGEMTLEEFLVRAGVVREDMNQQPAVAVQQRPMVGSNSASNNSHGVANNSNSIFFGDLTTSNNGNSGIALGFSQTPGRNAGGVVHSQIPNGSAASLAMSVATTRPYPAPLQVAGNVDLGNQQGMRGGGIVGIGDPGMNNGLMSSVVGLGGGGGVTVAAVGSPDGLGKGNGDLSSLSPVPYHLFGSGMRGRKCSGAVEKVVERRQRRMIKNRESAARSRARKQAYTMELEAEVAKLKEQNQELQKKQEEIMKLQKNQVMEMINQQRGPKKICLRRTQTGPW